MKRLALVVALAALAGAPAVLAQTTPPDYTSPPAGAAASPPSGTVPAMPSLDANQSAEVQRQLAPYRSQVDARVARGEISAEEAGRLLQWREWQLARQVTAHAAQTANGPYNVAPGPYASTPPDYVPRATPGSVQAPPPGYDAAQPRAYDQASPGYDQAPPPGYDQAPPPAAGSYYAAPPYYVPYYGPYYAPYYYGPTYYRPAPYYWGTRICAGGWGHHGGARVCF